MVPSEPHDGATLAVDDAGWFDLVRSHPSALPYHHPGWCETLADTYGYETFVIALRTARGTVIGGVPIAAVGNRLLGRRWVALPFSDSCGPLAGSEADEAALLELLAEECDRQGISSVEIRSPVASPRGTTRLRGVMHELELSDPDAHFGAFEPQVRRNIRKAERSGLTVRRGESRDDLARVYYRLHVETRQRLGVPTQPRRFFDALWRRLIEPELGSVLLAYKGRTPVAGAVFLEWNSRLVYKFGASDEHHWALRPNNLIFWECIKSGCASGARTLDFGRSDLESSGLRAFKASWGAREQDLHYTAFGSESEARAGSAERLLRPLIRHTPTWVGRGLGEAFYRLAA
jgi:CelD/BcsL family acetyltransferase involved in cellulose biosynthesis